jgi:hypothetical protein
MAFDLYDASIPGLIHMLGSLSSVLAKGEAHGGIDPAEARLAPDMLPLKAQVYIATDSAKGCGARLAGVDIPKYEDVEVSFADLRARVARTVEFLKGLDRAQFAGAENKHIVLKFPAAQRLFPHHHRLRHPAQPRRGAGQEYLPRGVKHGSRADRPADEQVRWTCESDERPERKRTAGELSPHAPAMRRAWARRRGVASAAPTKSSKGPALLPALFPWAADKGRTRCWIAGGAPVLFQRRQNRKSLRRKAHDESSFAQSLSPPSPRHRWTRSGQACEPTLAA